MKQYLLKILVLLSVLFNDSVAEDKAKAVIIFDASGSMWGQINGTPKISIARDALKNVIREWNPNVELGLTAYGHRSKGDCNDIETIIPVGRVDKNKVIRTVMEIQPKGKTPISRSLRKVANEIRYTEEKATIILISDGKETCDPDPCGTAKELKKQGIDFVTHVIGFNVDRNTDKQLECIAHATGGEYFSAKNATALNKAIKVIAKKVEKVKPKPVVKKLKKNLEITASEKVDGRWVSTIHYIYNIVNGEKEEQITNCWSEKKNSCLEKIPVGKYIIVSEYNEFKKETPIEIKSGELLKVNIVMGQTGKVEITASETEGGRWVSAIHYIYYTIEGEKEEQITNCWSEKKTSCIQKIPVGKYIMVSEYNKFKRETPIEIKSGDVNRVNVVFAKTNKISISASEKEGAKWVAAFHDIYKMEDGEIGERITNCWSAKKKECVRQIPLGKYLIKSSYNQFNEETEFEIKAEESTKVNIVFGETNKVIISASKKEDGKWVAAFHDIYKMEDGEIDERITNCWSAKKKECVHQIPLGKYLLKSSYNRFNKETPFEIKVGKPTTLHIIFEPFIINTQCSDMNSQVSYEVYASNGRMVYDKQLICSKPLVLMFNAGNYSVEAKVEKGIKEEKFTIGGDISTLTIDMSSIQEETREELINADTQNVVPTVGKDSKKSLEVLGKMFEGLSKEVGKTDAKDMEKAGDFLKVLGGLMGGTLTKEQQAIQKEKEAAQQVENEKAEKEFDDMSQELNMFTH